MQGLTHYSPTVGFNSGNPNMRLNLMQLRSRIKSCSDQEWDEIQCSPDLGLNLVQSMVKCSSAQQWG